MPVLYVCRSGKSHPPLQDALSRHRSLTLSRIRARKRLCERVGSSIWSNSADSSDRSGPLGSNVNANSPQERPSRFLWGKLPWPNQLLGPKSIEKVRLLHARCEHHKLKEDWCFMGPVSITFIRKLVPPELQSSFTMYFCKACGRFLPTGETPLPSRFTKTECRTYSDRQTP
jgi:hypothetical protein